ncbi:FAD-dependent oxidoreductase [[Clostridium] hylemonae]|uniref:FAD-dependent oxidoreductase n=1 Tax=[Clostridium] hylemonae TaxID=89153 RepID=UPI001FCBA773|nr:FAD-dependent oxidoreductase [[Clostridium] hylemonae]BDF03113.1 pyridine nucleotide-disulfide oxidoreductase [[Clostridium] hylemonae]
MSGKRKSYDAVVIGFGKGGKTIAGALGSAGKKVAMIEQSTKMYGGTCINVGCIPTKSLVNSAKEAAFGCRDGREVYAEAVQRKAQLVEKLRGKNYQKLAGDPNITVIDGKARFVSPHEVEVDTAEETLIVSGEQFFINTGSVPFIPPVKGIENNPYVYLSETLLDMEELPERLVIIGGGYIGVEFASIYADFGSKVSILQDGPVFLPREDEETAREVRGSLERRGVRVLTEVKVEEVKEASGHAEVVISTKEGTDLLEAEAVLAATGRRPNTKGLNLEAAGVQVNERGGIITDDSRTTTAPHIYAMGDVVGGLQFTYISLDDYRIVRSKIMGDGSYTLDKRGAVPYSVFLNPPFSRVGMSEAEALKAGHKVKTARLGAAAIPKAQVLRQPEGLLKAVIDEDTGRILGAHLFCEESHELINLVKIAMDAGLHYTVLRDMIFTHPTMGEALNDLFNV